MQQIYHSNARTNVHNREQIQKCSSVTNEELASRFNVSSQTVSKWRNRDFAQDASCSPLKIKYALSEIQTSVIISLRSTTWLPLDEVYEAMLAQDSSVSRSSVYRCFVKNNLNNVPQEKKDIAKKFKAYQPGYLHIDVTYLPKFNGKSYYLFVAIDRATRTLFYCIYPNKSALSTDDFFDKCVSFFPVYISHILTDNGLEFTNRLIKSKKGTLCTKDSLLDIKCKENNIEHRLTKPATPKTNGMVERVNGTIKNNTILRTKYLNLEQMNAEMMQFLIHYNIDKRHGSLRKELNVKTPLQAVEKWHELKPELFKISPTEFKNKLLNLNNIIVNNHQ